MLPYIGDLLITEVRARLGGHVPQVADRPSYSTRVGEKTTKADAVKHVPVHPTLAAMLAEWKLGGWAAMMGRAPGQDDLIVPLPPDAAERRYKRKGEPFRTTYYSGKCWSKFDPRRALGKAVVAGTGISIDILRSRYRPATP